jgi:hypothetical protein
MQPLAGIATGGSIQRVLAANKVIHSKKNAGAWPAFFGFRLRLLARLRVGLALLYKRRLRRTGEGFAVLVDSLLCAARCGSSTFGIRFAFLDEGSLSGTS